MCGEHKMASLPKGAVLGSSPHVRGARGARSDTVLQLGIIPACAGSTMVASHSGFGSGDHPRMCGEHPKITASALGSPGSSPHVRGAQEGYFVR